MRMRDDQREKEIHMTHIIGKAAATCAVAGLLVLGGVMPSQGQRAYYGVYAGPYGGFAYVPGYRSYWVPQYDTSGARVDPDVLGWHGWPPSGAPANPCTLGAAQQNRC
jgi:hypothetical protein